MRALQQACLIVRKVFETRGNIQYFSNWQEDKNNATKHKLGLKKSPISKREKAESLKE
ncbi:hypothetical protein RND71_016113 [Anisodus tanguticus]|uniref:Uncharacterized protein n=1 Tax=Anisodus tanguticus TaxID=243964 RepID=A0AAE1S759_9SOLA|nr:hypothetical protein RND71_016113 [Anisodus tanguticus]